MAALNTSTFAYALKKRYSPRKVQDMAYKASRSPFYAMVRKNEGFGGANYTFAVNYSDIKGRSVSFQQAQATKEESDGKAFVLTRVKDYALASIDSETIYAARGNENSLLESVKREMNSAINALGRSIAISLYGDGSGEIGSISSISSGVVTLTNINDDITNFEVGQTNVAATSSAAAPRAAAGVVTSIDRDAGTVTYDSGVSPSGWTAADELFVKGDYAAASDRNKIMGLAGWVPTSAPSAGGGDSHFGVDRAADATRLAGVRYSGSGKRLDEALFGAAVRVAREGGKPDCVFLSYNKYEELINILGSKLEYQTTQLSAGIGFEGAKIHGPAGVLNIYPDLNAPADKAYVLTKDSWELRSLGPAPRVLDLDGLRMQREATADAYEFRLAFFGNLYTDSPGWNAVVTGI
jgi:hypothetical protein